MPSQRAERGKKPVAYVLSPIYTTENSWHGSDKNGTGTRKCGTYSSFTHPFFSRTKHCKIRSGTGTWLKFLTSRHTRNPSAHAALFTKHGAILSGTSAHSLGKLVQTKGAEDSSENVGSARAIVYTGHFIRAGFFFLVHVPILPVLALPFQ